MFDQIAIMGLVIAIVQIVKIRIPHFATKEGKVELPLIVVFLAGLLNVINAAMFGDVALNLAFKDGLYSGIVATGLYASGTAMLDKSKK
jgi:hypothetical protein